MSDHSQRLAALIKARRLELELGQGAVAEACGVSQPAISDWEAGRKVPTVENLFKLARALDLNFDEMLDPAPAGTGSDGGSSELSAAAASESPPGDRHRAHPRGAPAPLSSGPKSNDTDVVTSVSAESGSASIGVALVAVALIGADVAARALRVTGYLFVLVVWLFLAAVILIAEADK